METMKDFVTITYIGHLPEYVATFGEQKFSFEWQKGVGIGTRKEEIPAQCAFRLSKMRDKRGKKVFLLEKYAEIN